jgi:hypothetical protein
VPSRGETTENPVEGSSFWVGKMINGEFYFYIYKNALWYFSNDVQEVYSCPIKVWLDPGQQEILNIWYKGYQEDLGSSKDYLTRDTKDILLGCYPNVQASSLEIPVKALKNTDISHLFNLNMGSVFVSGVEYFNLTYFSGGGIEKGVGILFYADNSYLNIGEKTFENIAFYSNPKQPSYIYLNKEGEIIRADFNVNVNGGMYNFNGKEIFVPPFARVFFETRPTMSPIETEHLPNGIDIQLSSNSDLTKFSNLLNFNQELFSQIYRGENIKFEDFILEKGEVMFQDEGILLLSDREENLATWNDLKLDLSENKKNLLIANYDTNLANYNGNWIQQKDANHLHMSISEFGTTKIDVLEGNDLFDVSGGDKLNFILENKNAFEIVKTKDSVTLNPGKGEFTIVNGNNFLSFRDGRVYYETDLSRLGANFNSVPLKIESSSSFKESLDEIGYIYTLLFDNFNSFTTSFGQISRISFVHGPETNKDME